MILVTLLAKTARCSMNVRRLLDDWNSSTLLHVERLHDINFDTSAHDVILSLLGKVFDQVVTRFLRPALDAEVRVQNFVIWLIEVNMHP